MNDDALVRDVIRDWPVRAVVGQRLCARVGARAWDPPPFARGRKLFPKFGLPDPWDPGAPVVDIGLGDVALPERRVVAPHAAPPPAPGSPQKPGLPNLPRAAQRNESAEPPKGKPAPQIGEVRKFDPSELKPKAQTTAGRPQAPAKKPDNPRIFGSAPVRHAVAKLPVRPGFGGGSEPGAPPEPLPPGAAQPATTPSTPPSPTAASPVHAPRPGQIVQAAGRPAAVPPVATPRGGATSAANPSSVGSPSRPAAPATTVAAPLRPPPPAPPTPTSSPAPTPPTPPAPASPPRPAAPVNRKPPGPGGGLDDLFGMGAGDNTRIKLPKPAEGDPPRPRRPVVSSPEELARLGLDRRPPPAKPPPGSPTPSSSPAPSSPKDDLPDE